MSLLSLAAMPLASNVTNNQTMGAGGLVVLVVVILASLSVLLLAPVLAGRQRHSERPVSSAPPTGPVMGGMHLGDGRSVAPHRDEPADTLSTEGASQDVSEGGQQDLRHGTVRDARGEAASEPETTARRSGPGESGG